MRKYLDIGLCITCTFLRQPSSRCSAAPVCEICGCKGLHHAQCSMLSMKQQGRVSVWKHGDVPKAFPSGEIDILLLELHSFQGYSSNYSIPPSIEKLWTCAHDAHDAILASEEEDEEPVEIELIDLDHLKVSGSRKQSVFQGPKSTVRDMPATEDGNEETPTIHHRELPKTKKTSILQEVSSADQDRIPQIMPTSLEQLDLKPIEIDDLILDAMENTREFLDVDEDVQEPERQTMSLSDGAISACDTERSTSITTKITMPNLIEVIQHLVHNMNAQQYQLLDHEFHPVWIEELGGEEAVVQDAYRCVEPAFIDLIGREITAETLHLIKCGQASVNDYESWPSNSGYLDFLTDSRNLDYWRPYVGQTVTPLARITRHIQTMKIGDKTSLHYYVFNNVPESRCWNFVRLWTINTNSGENTNASSETRNHLLSNILEMTFCRAFQSLPALVLEAFFGRLPDCEYSNLGLNVLPPLYQGCIQTQALALRGHYRDFWKASPDPEIRSWPAFRRAQLNRNWVPNCGAKDHEQAIEAFLKCSDLNGLHFDGTKPPEVSEPFDIDEELAALSTQIDPVKALIPPVGSIHARLGVMWDPCSLAKSKRVRQTHMPWGMENAGLGSTNTLVWTPTLGTDDLQNATSTQSASDLLVDNNFMRFNRKLLAASALRVVLVCGRRVEKHLQNLLHAALSPVYILRLSTYEIPTYLQVCESNILRIFFVSPSPWINWTGSKLIQAKELREILKFAAHITKTDGIRYDFYESSGIVVRFIDDYISEKQLGSSRITSSSLPVDYRRFLYNTGFDTDESIRNLERAAGTLLTGMVMLINLLRRNTIPPSSQNLQETRETFGVAEVKERAAKASRRGIHPARQFDRDRFNETKALYEQMSGRSLSDAQETADQDTSNQPIRFAVRVQQQRRRDALFKSQKGYRIKKSQTKGGRGFRLLYYEGHRHGLAFAAPDNFDVKKGCWVRAEYDKDSQQLHPNRYAEEAKVGSAAATFRLIVTGEDLSGVETSFYATNSHHKAPVWVKELVEQYEEAEMD